MTTVVEDLGTITKVERLEEENSGDFLNRMVAAINGLSEEDWEKLPESGKSWFNEAAKIIENTDENMGFELPIIPGMEETLVTMEEAPVTMEEAPVTMEEAPVTMEEAPVTEVVVQEKKLKKKREGPPVTQIARELFCSDISMSLNDLIELLEKQNVAIKKSTAQVVYLNTLRAYETAQALGEVKKDGKVILKAVS